MLRLLVAAIAGLLTISVTAEAQQAAPSLIGPTWYLVRYGDVTSPKSVLGGRQRPATLRFGVSETGIPPPPGEDSLSVFDGCNHVFGLSYRVNADRLIITFSKGWGGTAMACLRGQELPATAIILGLQKSERFLVQRNMLTIFYDGGKSALVFSSDN
jgi:META domain